MNYHSLWIWCRILVGIIPVPPILPYRGWWAPVQRLHPGGNAWSCLVQLLGYEAVPGPNQWGDGHPQPWRTQRHFPWLEGDGGTTGLLCVPQVVTSSSPWSWPSPSSVMSWSSQLCWPATWPGSHRARWPWLVRLDHRGLLGRPWLPAGRAHRVDEDHQLRDRQLGSPHAPGAWSNRQGRVRDKRACRDGRSLPHPCGSGWAATSRPLPRRRVNKYSSLYGGVESDAPRERQWSSPMERCCLLAVQGQGRRIWGPPDGDTNHYGIHGQDPKVQLHRVGLHWRSRWGGQVFPTVFDAITRSAIFISQAMVYQPNWNHLDEEGGCCMLYMVAHDLNIDK